MKMMRKEVWFFVSIVLCCSFSTVFADIDLTAHILNPSFEIPSGLFPGESANGLEGWESLSGRVNSHSVIGPETQRPSSSPYPSEGDHYADPFASLISQRIGSITIQANTTYTMTADVMIYSSGPGPDVAWFEMGIDAFESGERLTTYGSAVGGYLRDNDSRFETEDVFYTVTCSFDSSVINPNLIGETLSLFAHGDWVKIDNFTLGATGTLVNLTVDATVGAEDAVLIPANGPGIYPVGNGWVIPLDAMVKSVNCPDLHTFSQWNGADVAGDNITEVTISGNTTVTATYSTTSPGCVDVNEPVQNLVGDNFSFEDPVLDEGTELGSAAPPPGWGWIGGSFLAQRNPAPGLEVYGGPEVVTDGNNAIKTLGWAGQWFIIYQNLTNSTGYTIKDNTQHTLSVDVYVPTADYYPNQWLNLIIGIAGGEYMAVFDQQTTLNDYMAANGYGPDEWFTVDLEWQHTNTHTDQPLVIQIGNTGIWIDNVRFSTATTVSGIPATLTLQADPVEFDSYVVPAPDDYILPIGYEMAVSAVTDRHVECPNVYTLEWQGDGSRRFTWPANLSQTVLVDDDISVIARYITDNQCNDECRPYPSSDLSKDCVVDLEDFAIMASEWLTDVRP